PGGLRPRRAPPPHPIGVFLMLWLVFRMNFESGAAKLLTGDPTWRDLSAMETYYETAPLPTWVGWYAHQLPAWAQRLSAAYTLPVLGVRVLGPAHRAIDTVRTLNAYHLFAHMTLVRKEVVIEGSADGETWEPYEFRFKPGDPMRPPPFAAPHQPRVDFQLWFLL